MAPAAATSAMLSLITVYPTSAVVETSGTNEYKKVGYGRKHKLIHDGYSFNRKNDGKKAVQYNCIKIVVNKPYIPPRSGYQK